jgi:hypothetical protein
VIPRRQYCTLTPARLNALSRRAARARLRRLSPTLRSRCPICSVCRFILTDVSRNIFLSNPAPTHWWRRMKLRVRHYGLVTPCRALSSNCKHPTSVGLAITLFLCVNIGVKRKIIRRNSLHRVKLAAAVLLSAAGPERVADLKSSAPRMVNERACSDFATLSKNIRSLYQSCDAISDLAGNYDNPK